MMDNTSLAVAAPEIFLLLMACVIAMVDLGVKSRLRNVTYWLTMATLAVIAFYTGDRFPRWRNDLFVAMLAATELRRVRTKGRIVVEQETIFKGFGRVRHVVVGPDGLLYVALNDPGRIVRLVPAD